MSTYAQSCNRTLNTNRHIESSVGGLFSCDSCILVRHLNFTNKAPPIIKTLTNFSHSHFFHLPVHTATPMQTHHNHDDDPEPSRRWLFLIQQPLFNRPPPFILLPTSPPIIVHVRLSSTATTMGTNHPFQKLAMVREFELR
jgi:hypothetical protein